MQNLLIQLRPLRHLAVWQRYALTTLVVLACFGIRFILEGIYPYPFLLFLPAVIIASFFFNRGSGIYASCLSSVLAMYYFIPSPHSFSFENIGDIVSIMVFLMVGLLIATVIEIMRKTVEKLYESEEQFRLMVEGTKDYAIFMLDPQGYIVSWNPGVERIKGYKESEIIGKHFSIFYPQEEQDRHKPEKELGIAMIEGKYEEEGWRIHKDGSPFWAHVLITTLYDQYGNLKGFSKITRDISRQEQSKQAMLQSEERFRLAVEAAPNAMLMVNSEGEIELVNSQIERMFGYKRSELLGKKVEMLLPKQLRFEHMKHRKHYMKHPEVRQMGVGRDLFGLHRDGTEIPVEIGLNPITIHGKTHTLASVVDITMRKAAESALQEASRRKDEFLASISHELRTPMNAVVGLANILATSQPLTEQQEKYVHTLQLSAKELLAIINDLLDIAKIENQSVELETVPFDIHKLVDEVCAINSVRAKEKNIRLDVRYASEPPGNLMGDPLRIRQILMNLISNAIKFTGDNGSVTVAVDCLLTDSPLVTQLRIEVSDTGIGIPPDKRDSIFSRFSQADTTITRRYGGTGLGLSITKALVDLMEGQIMVESELEQGSRFTVLLPLPLQKGLANIQTVNNEDAAQVTKNKDSHRPSILLVEDYKANIMVAEAVLDSFGFRYETVHSGKAALDKLMRESKDIVLMDIQMPEMDGLTATRLLREWELANNQEHIPVIGMTAHALPGDKERCLAAGMDDYITKPFDPDELHTLLLKHINPQLMAA